MAGPSFYQLHVPKFGPSGSGRRYIAGTPITNPRGGGVRRLRFPGMSYTTIENRYVVGAGVGSTNAAARRALRRRASTGQNGRPCGFDCPSPANIKANPPPVTIKANLPHECAWFDIPLMIEATPMDLAKGVVSSAPMAMVLNAKNSVNLSNFNNLLDDDELEFRVWLPMQEAWAVAGLEGTACSSLPQMSDLIVYAKSDGKDAILTAKLTVDNLLYTAQRSYDANSNQPNITLHLKPDEGRLQGFFEKAYSLRSVDTS